MLAFLKALFAKFFAKKVAEVIEHQLNGWIADKPDDRDLIYKAPRVTKTRALAPSADLTPLFGPVESQGTLNSCVGHAVTSAVEVGIKSADKSRLFVYYNARANEWSTARDAGCSIRSAISGVAKKGACAESLWPYDASKVLVAPSAAANSDGLSVPPKISTYERVTTLAALKGAINSGLPVVFGFKVYQHFRTETATTGMYSFPAGQAQIGSHAVVAVGYDDTTGMVKCRNSFGSGWGQAGYFYMPYTWFANFTSQVSDAWVIRPKV